MKVYYAACDGGDGNMDVEFFLDPKVLERLEDEQPEYYRSDSGLCWLDLPDDANLKEIGIDIVTMEDAFSDE